MKDYTSENPAFSEKIRIVEESDLVNAENDAAASKQLLQNDLVLSARLDKCLGSVESGLELDEGIASDTLIGAVNEVFQFGSESKRKLVENLTAMGVAASTDDTWGTLLDKILDMTDTSRDTVTAAALLSGYTAHDAAGAKITGTLADKSAITDHSATASLDAANKRLKLKVPATAKYSSSNYLYAAYSAIASLAGLTSAKLVKNNTVLGITGSSGNMDTSGATAVAADILSGKKAGVKGSLLTGSMANKGAWTGATTGNGNVAIPAGYHNGSGYVSGSGAYNKGVSDADARVNTGSANYQGGYSAGVRDADGRVNTGSTNYQTGYSAGVSATKVGTAGAGDVLSGKTFTNGSSVGASGTMADKGGATVDAGAVTQDDNYTYLTVPVNGYYNTSSRLRAQSSGLVPDSFFGLPFILRRNNTGAGDNKPSTNVARLCISGKYRNSALRADGHITSNTGTSLKVTITAHINGVDTEIYTSSGSGKQDKDYSATIPAGTEYIEITAYHGSTGQQISYEVRLNSLTIS